MRALIAVSLFALLCPAAGLAQAPATAGPGAARARSDGVPRDLYIERAVERAKKRARTRFEKLDTNHDGVLSADERRAGRPPKRRSASE